MKIQRINSVLNNNLANINKHEEARENKAVIYPDKQGVYATNPASYGLTFGARVDKGLIRFYEYNAPKMPGTVKAYIEGLADKTSQTPLQAHAAAFAALAGAATIGAIQALFPDEELFKDLKSPDSSRATRGILGTYRENKELLGLYNRSVLANGEDLTVWLVKKIFLESKTLDEINKDFENEVDSEFRYLFESKEEKHKAPIAPSTLNALGIKSPEAEYMQSLRYTRDGYSDMVGEKISQVQKAFWESMPLEERTARNRKSVDRFEKWWESLSHDQKLDMIAAQMDELEMLEQFNSSEIGRVKGGKKYAEKELKPLKPKTERVSRTSALSRDELFKIWAGNNLKIFEANLSELDKKRIETRRIQRRIEAWDIMTPEERTEYINRLRSGAEPLRYAIIQAWNENPDILVELSRALTKDHVEKPEEIIYGSEAFNDFMSNSMTRFWKLHPDFAKKFGESISAAHNKIKDSIAAGHYEKVKSEIMYERESRMKYTSGEVKNYKEVIYDEGYEAYPEYMKEFIDAFCSCKDVAIKYFPTLYLKDMFKSSYETLDEKTIRSWTKHLYEDDLTAEEEIELKKVGSTETFSTIQMNRAIEATLAEILYDCTKRCEVFLFSTSQLAVAIKQVADGNENIVIEVEDDDEPFVLPIEKNALNTVKINNLYEHNRKQLSDFEINGIIERFFNLDPKKTRDLDQMLKTAAFLRNYIRMFGNSINIVFSDESKYPREVRLAFLEKFRSLIPDFVDKSTFANKAEIPGAVIKEDKIIKIDGLLRKKYSFLPEDMMTMYIYEMNKVLRTLTHENLDKMAEIIGKISRFAEAPKFTFNINRSDYNGANNLHVLCMEQALADALYNSTGERKVYALTFEELIDCFESFTKANRFPLNIKDVHSSLLKEFFDVRLKKRINLSKLEPNSNEYAEGLISYMSSIEPKKEFIDVQHVVDVLQPNMGEEDGIDIYVRKRVENAVKNL